MTTLAKIGIASFDTIGAACEAAFDGQTVTVIRDGNLAETLVALNKPGNYKILGQKDPSGKLIKLHVDGTIRPAWGKGIFDLEAGNHEIGYLHFDGCTCEDSNGSGVRLNNGIGNVYVHHCLFTNNENGILTGSGNLTIEDTTFDSNGQSADPGQQGYSHNLYAGALENLTVTRTSFLRSAYGHDLKSRAKKTVLTQVLCEDSANSRELDLPNGGILDAKDSKFSKPATSTMNNLVDIGAEGINDGRPESYTMTNCHFHNDVDPARDVQYINNHSSVEVVLVDPLFTGAAASKDRKATIRGNVRIVLTGGPLGPRVPVGNGPVPAPPAPIPAPPAPAPFPVMNGTWVKIGVENQVVQVEPNTTVRYGFDTRWVMKVMSGSFSASNDVFGDPAKSTAKVIEKFIPAASAPAPAPVPAPAPAPAPAPVPVPVPAPVPAPAPAPKPSSVTTARYQEAKVGDVMASFAKSIAAPAGETVTSTDWFFDAAKGVVVFKLTTTKP